MRRSNRQIQTTTNFIWIKCYAIGFAEFAEKKEFFSQKILDFSSSSFETQDKRETLGMLNFSENIFAFNPKKWRPPPKNGAEN